MPPLDVFIPLALGALGVLAMLPVTITLYRRFLAKPIATKTKTTFIEAADDENFVEPMKKTLLWRELSGDTAGIVQLATARIDSIPNSIREVVDMQLKESTKVLNNNLASNLESAVNSIHARINEVEAKLAGRRGFAAPGSDPTAAQEKGVESRKVNQIVDAIEGQVLGDSWETKVKEVSELLDAVGQSDLSDWLQENPGKISLIERRIRSNPRLAAEINKFRQGKGGAGSAGRGGEL